MGDDFDHFAGRLGLQQAATAALRESVRLRATGTAVSAAAAAGPGQPRLHGRGGRAALPLIEAAQGGAFLLFTSHRALRAAAALLEDSCAARWPLLVQGTAPREQLLRTVPRQRQRRAARYRELLGRSGRAGAALRLVIIDKLPFASPEDPVVRARIEHLESQGLGAFRSYQLPEAVLALKQGVGRLIRSEADRGVVMLCDPRLHEPQLRPRVSVEPAAACAA